MRPKRNKQRSAAPRPARASARPAATGTTRTPESRTPPARGAAKKKEREPSPVRASPNAQRIALLAATAGLDKKAGEIEIIDVTGKVDYADFLVLMTGQSDRHVATIAQAVDELLSKNGTEAISFEGLPRGSWVLIDFVDVVVHVFLEESRALYDLEGLWMDARRIPVPSETSDA